VPAVPQDKKKCPATNRFAIVQIFFARFLQVRDRVRVIALLVIGESQFVRQRLGGGLFAFDVVKHGERSSYLPCARSLRGTAKSDAGDCAVAVPVVALVEGEVWAS